METGVDEGSNHRAWIDGTRAAVVAGTVLGASLLLRATFELWNGWRSHGDIAAMAVRARSTFSADVALTGMPTTAVGGGFHPGPLELWLGGVVQVITGDAPQSLLAATVAVNLAAVATIVVASAMAWGRSAALIAGAASCALGWSLYGPDLITPFNPYAGLHPAAAAIVAALALARRGNSAALAVAAALFGSYAMQAHVTYLVLVPVVVIPILVSAARSGRLRGRALVTGALAGLIAWIGPLVDAAANRGGNLRALLTSAGGDEATITTWRSVRIVAGAIDPVPVFADRDIVATEIFRGASTAGAIATLVVMTVIVGTAVVLARRSGSPDVTRAAIAVVALAFGAAASITAFPDQTFNVFARHNYLSLWILGVAAWTLAATLAVLAIRARWSPAGAFRWPAVASIGVAVLVSVTAPSLPTPAAHAYIDALAPQVIEALDRNGSYQVEIAPQFLAFDVASGLVDALDAEGIDARVSDDLEPSFGAAVAGTEATDTTAVIRVVVGEADPGDRDEIATYLPDATLVASRDRAVAAVRATVEADPALASPFCDVAADCDLGRFIRDDLAGLVIGGFVEGGLADHPAVRTLVELRDRPIEQVRVTVERR